METTPMSPVRPVTHTVPGALRPAVPAQGTPDVESAFVVGGRISTRIAADSPLPVTIRHYEISRLGIRAHAASVDAARWVGETLGLAPLPRVEGYADGYWLYRWVGSVDGVAVTVLREEPITDNAEGHCAECGSLARLRSTLANTGGRCLGCRTVGADRVEDAYYGRDGSLDVRL